MGFSVTTAGSAPSWPARVLNSISATDSTGLRGVDVAPLPAGTRAVVSNPVDGLYIPSGVTISISQAFSGNLYYTFVLMVDTPLPAQTLPDVVHPATASGGKYWAFDELSMQDSATNTTAVALPELVTAKINGRSVYSYSPSHPTV